MFSLTSQTTCGIVSVQYFCCLETTIDKVYIDGSCQLLIRRSMEKLSAENFWNQEILEAILVLQTLKFGNSRAKKIKEDHVFVSCLCNSGSHDSLFKNAQAKHWLRFRVTCIVQGARKKKTCILSGKVCQGEGGIPRPLRNAFFLLLILKKRDVLK